MNKKFYTDIKNIKNAIDTNKLIVFAGAGISIDAGIPGWGTLINDLISEIELPSDENDYLKIAQMYYNERQQKEYIEKIRVSLKHKKIKHNEIHEEIFQLNPVHILTTNFDNLLEQVIKKNSLPFSVVTKDKEFPYALNTNLLVKIHGDLDDTDIVLKEDDYIDYGANHPLMEAFLKSVFASKLVLFIGYSFSDINLKMIVQNVRNVLGKDFQNAYLLSVDENVHPAQKEYLKNKGINVVNYFDAENSITSYLDGINALKEKRFIVGSNLSKKGQNLLNFIRFISTYDKFIEPLIKVNLIDQIYLSLDRFSEFTSLPPDFVTNLYPFNNSKNYVHNYEEYSLVTKNHNLYDLFFNQIEYDKDKDEVKFKPSLELKLTPKQIEKYEKKLYKIIKFLNFSSIIYFLKENDKPDSSGNYGLSSQYKELRVKLPKDCNCLNCRYGRLELNDVLNETQNSNINETTNLNTDIEIAYSHYKIGNFRQSFNLFEEIANKAWQTGKYFTYYIAKHNIKTLRNLLRNYELNVKKEEKDRILKLMEDVDFDKLLFQIPFMGNAEYELLKMIRDDSILTKAKEQINEILIKISEVYDGYRKGTSWTMSPYYPQKIQVELNKIMTFYINNHIIIDEYSNFTNVCDKGIEAFIISYATSNDYENRLKEFDKSFFDLVVFYGNAKKIKGLTIKYKVDNLIFNSESIDKIMLSVNNFLKSFFDTSFLFGVNTYKNDVVINQADNHFFENSCRKKFDNIFLLLSGIELKKEHSIELISNLIHFLKHETFLYGDSIKYLGSFLVKNSHLFSKENLIELLTSIKRKIRVYHDNMFFDAVKQAFKKNNFDGISNRELILNILNDCKTYDKNRKFN